MGFYRNRTHTIEARQFIGTPSSSMGLYDWIRANNKRTGGPNGVTIKLSTGCLLIKTSAGVVKPVKGDWIIKGVESGFSVLKQEEFEAKFEAVAE